MVDELGREADVGLGAQREQTFAIGGLIQNQVGAITNKTPVLGDLPFIGPAFSTIGRSLRTIA